MGQRLLAWYRANRRSLPWRDRPEPYRVWVSEMMLQQTQVDTVLPYFERWMARFPDIAALADAEEDAVLSMWQGLGYYSRARSLWQAARDLRAAGKSELPDTVAGLRALPGIGDYTAGAIASIAFERDEPVVDGNVIRVLARWLALGGDPNKRPLRDALWQFARRLLVEGQAGDFNQGLMELGALVCRPKQPSCGVCPLQSDCRGLEAGLVDTLPAIAKRPKATKVLAVAAVLEHRGRLLVARAPADANRWASMWMFPSVELGAGENVAQGLVRAVSFWTGLNCSVGERLGFHDHSVTRYRIRLEWHRVEPSPGKLRARPGSELRYCDAVGLRALAMPAAHRVIANSLERS
jgi:A/G-specific adenine glycosylase